jgi:hypothetical protein
LAISPSVRFVGALSTRVGDAGLGIVTTFFVVLLVDFAIRIPPEVAGQLTTTIFNSRSEYKQRMGQHNCQLARNTREVTGLPSHDSRWRVADDVPQLSVTGNVVEPLIRGPAVDPAT